VPVAAPLVPSGARIFAAGGSQRTKTMPDAPTFAELGVKSLARSDSWNVVFINAATPQALVDKLSAELTAVLREPQTAAHLAKLGFTLAPAGAEEFAQVAQETAARWQQALAGVRKEQK
jgi:tripartite-type tricarboxylate transporter receptor subunit TctC